MDFAQGTFSDLSLGNQSESQIMSDRNPNSCSGTSISITQSKTLIGWPMRKRENLRRKNVNISSRRIQPPTHCNVDYIIEIGLRQWKRCVLPDLFTGTCDNYFSDGSTHQVRDGPSVGP